MTILFLTKHLNFGGIPRHVVDLALGLKRRGHGVYIASSGGMLEEELKLHKINHIYIPIDTKSELSPKIWFSLLRLLGFVRKEKIDLIHAHRRATHVLAGLASYITKIPYLTTCHDITRPRLGRRIFPFLGKKVITVGDGVVNKIIKVYGAPRSKIRLIYNGVNVKSFDNNQMDKKSIRKNFGLNDDSFVIGNVARLVPVKGQSTLIEITKKLREKGKNVELLLVGEGKFKGQLKALAHQEGISENVIFIERLKDLKSAFKAMDLFCFLTLDDAFGIALIEAMASGLPVMASSISQIPHILKNGECGILVAPRDVSTAVEKILFLLENKDMRRKLGEAAREYVASEFSLDKMVDSTIKVYEEALS